MGMSAHGWTEGREQLGLGIRKCGGGQVSWLMWSWFLEGALTATSLCFAFNVSHQLTERATCCLHLTEGTGRISSGLPEASATSMWSKLAPSCQLVPSCPTEPC